MQSIKYYVLIKTLIKNKGGEGIRGLLKPLFIPRERSNCGLELTKHRVTKLIFNSNLL